MGGAILTGILNSPTSGESEEGAAPFSRYIAGVQREASAKKLETSLESHKNRLEINCGDSLACFRAGDVILLACKPYMANGVLGKEGIREALDGKLLISILPGILTSQLEEYIYGTDPATCCIINAMPNMAAQIGESITLISTPPSSTPQTYLYAVSWIFESVGKIHYVSEENYLASLVVCGTTPSFFTVAFDGILDGAVAEGINRDEACILLAHSLHGLAGLLESGEHPAVLREKISSPKGMSINGLEVLEDQAVRSAYRSAYRRAVAHGRKGD